jgi:hypothetical protein
MAFSKVNTGAELVPVLADPFAPASEPFIARNIALALVGGSVINDLPVRLVVGPTACPSDIV